MKFGSFGRRLAPLVLVLASLLRAAEPAGEAVEAARTAPANPAALSSTGAPAAAAPARTMPAPDYLEQGTDRLLAAFDLESGGNTVAHHSISLVLLLIALLARRIVTRLIFPALKRLAARTETTLDDKMFPALEGPAAALIVVFGLFSALRVLKLPAFVDHYLGAGSQVGFSLVVFWGLWRALGALLDHLNEVARERTLEVAAFLPWIRKSVLTIFAVVAALLTFQSLGFDVKAVLAGLGIGGLAFALAAQDTLANIFGAIVVAVDQPYTVGETVRIGANVGVIEDIGLRSTRIRLLDKSLMVIPNKTVAADTITNLSRFTGRRVEQVLALTYASRPEQLEELVPAIRALLEGRAEVEPKSVQVAFRDFSASSLDIWLAYEARDSDFRLGLQLRQEVNLALLRLVAARGLAFAYPTQTLEVAGPLLERLGALTGPPR
jgi:MscS family membrane protein